MKNNKVLIIVGILILNILVGYMIGQSFLGKQSDYEITLEKARDYAEQGLCSKAITEYQNAIVTKDTAKIRLEMIDVYVKGIENGEFTNIYNVVTDLIAITDSYRENVKIYERVCEVLVEYEKYEDFATVMTKANNYNISSEKLDGFVDIVKYKHVKNYAMYTEVIPTFEGMYTLGTEGTYKFYSDDMSDSISGNYTYASPYANGYAFVKTVQRDGQEKGFIINSEGERQIYLDKVESSSGVGKLTDKEGKTVQLLLACKIGDKYKYFDINGKEHLDEYAFAGRFRNNIAAVMESEGKWKIINGDGKAVIDKTFTDVILNEFDECAAKGYVFAKEKDKYQLYTVTAEGKLKQVEGFECDSAKAFVDDYAAFMKDDLWGYVDGDGKVVIEAQYEDAKSFSNGIGAVKAGEFWKFINEKEETVVEGEFEDTDYLNGKGICFVKSDGYWSYLDFYYTEK